ncbi:MAG: gluzincin family metallopeptidase [Anaerolineae bacterium]
MKAERTAGGRAGCGRGVAAVVLVLALLMGLRLLPELTGQDRAVLSSVPLDTILTGHSSALAPDAQSELDMLGDVPRYRVDARVDVEERTITGVLELTYTNRANALLWDLMLDARLAGDALAGQGRLMIGSVTRGEEEYEVEWVADGSVMRIPLDRALVPGEAITLVITFSAQSAGSRAQGSPVLNAPHLIFTSWYPRVVGHNPQATESLPARAKSVETGLHDITLTMPPGFDVISTGAEVSRREEPHQIVRRLVGGPSRGFGVAIGRTHQPLETRVADVTLRYHALEDPAGGRAAQVVLDESARFLAWFAEQFGAYPFVDLNLIEVDDISTPPLGSSCASFALVNRAWRASASDTALRQHLHLLIADQWWSGILGTGTEQDAWLSTALAAYTTVLYEEQVSGVEAGADRLARLLHDSEEQTSNWLARQAEARAARQAEMRGLLFLDALRDEMGDEAFAALLSAYAVRYRYREPTLEDFVALAEVIAGRELDELVQQWLGPLTGRTSSGRSTPTLDRLSQ